jgi:hypothetical protein
MARPTGSHAVSQHQSLVRIFFLRCPKCHQNLVCITFTVKNYHHLSTTEDCSESYTILKRRLNLRLHSHLNRTASARLICKSFSLPEGSRAQLPPARNITLRWSRNRSSIPDKDKRFFSSSRLPDRCWCSPSLLFNAYRGVFPRGKATVTCS